MTYHIAVILTVFNRREKTLSCLKHLFAAADSFEEANQVDGKKISWTVFLTDDGSTDGTADAVRESFPQRNIHILEGTGNLFWAGGMRLAWQAALHSPVKWDYFLLLNDDTNVFNNALPELFEADNYALSNFGKHGVVSGITCRPGHQQDITYGGFNFVNKAKGRHVIALPTGHPQHIDLTHANILLVHKSVVNTIGIFYQGYRHASADQDYGMMARRHNIPTLVTSHVCGECQRDHHSNRKEIDLLISMTLSERKAYLSTPTHSDADYLLFVRRNLPFRYPIAFMLRNIRIYAPRLYKRITHFRGVYNAD